MVVSRWVLCTRLDSKGQMIRWTLFGSLSGTILVSANKDETAVHGCHCPGDMAVRIHRYWAYRGDVLFDHRFPMVYFDIYVVTLGSLLP